MLRISNNMIEDPGTKQKLSDKLASVDSLIGNVTALTTNAKTSVVAAINENVSSLADIVYDVKNFGAKGDGVTDDTIAIQKAVSAIQSKSGGTLFFPKGNYLVGVTGDQQSIISFDGVNVIVDLNQSTITLKANKYQYYRIIQFHNCNYIVKNGYLVGDRLTHDYTTISGTHEQGYGIYSMGGTGIADNIVSSQFTGDGMFIQSSFLDPAKYVWGTLDQTSYVTVKNSEFHHCRRQGISIEDSGTTFVDNCYIHHIGTWDNVNGTNPQSGIDLEFEQGTNHAHNITLNNVTIENCTNYVIVHGNTADVIDNLIINNCNFNGQFSINCGTTFTVKNSILNLRGNANSLFASSDFHNCIFNLNVGTSLQLQGNCTDCTFNGAVDGTTGQSCTIENWSTQTNNMYRCRFYLIKGTTVINIDTSSYLNGFYKYNNLCSFKFYHCLFDSCNFSSTDTTGLLEFNHCTLNSCAVKSTQSETIPFYNCKLTNCTASNIFDPILLLENCTIIDSINNAFLGENTKTCMNCSINLTGTFSDNFGFRSTMYNTYLSVKTISIPLSYLTLYNSVLRSNYAQANISASLTNSSIVTF